MKFSQAPFWREGSHIYSLIFSQHFFELRKSSIFRRSFPHRSPFLFISLGGMHWGQTALKIRSSIFFVVVFFVVVTMVMNKLIQPELKPVSPPLEGLFLCSIVVIVFNKNGSIKTIIFCVNIRREGTESFYQSDVT